MWSTMRCLDMASLCGRCMQSRHLHVHGPATACLRCADKCWGRCWLQGGRGARTRLYSSMSTCSWPRRYTTVSPRTMAMTDATSVAIAYPLEPPFLALRWGQGSLRGEWAPRSMLASHAEHRQTMVVQVPAEWTHAYACQRSRVSRTLDPDKPCALPSDLSRSANRQAHPPNQEGKNADIQEALLTVEVRIALVRRAGSGATSPAGGPSAL